MKQNITEEQFNELSVLNKAVWIKWARDNGHTFNNVYPYLLDKVDYDDDMLVGFPSIGQMIEFLDEHGHAWYFKMFEQIGANSLIETKDICNYLWKAVKEVLNE